MSPFLNLKMQQYIRKISDGGDIQCPPIKPLQILDPYKNLMPNFNVLHQKQALPCPVFKLLGCDNYFRFSKEKLNYWALSWPYSRGHNCSF